MKHLKTILCLMALSVALGPWQPLHCQTKLYNQYKHRTDMVVACAMAFPVTDSVKVDVTILAPKTKEAVYYLVEEFNLGIEKDIIDEGLGNEENNFLKTYNVRKDDVREKFGSISSLDDYKSISRLLYRYSTGLVLVFHDIETKERSMAITSFINKSTKNPKILPNIEQILK